MKLPVEAAQCFGWRKGREPGCAHCHGYSLTYNGHLVAEGSLPLPLSELNEWLLLRTHPKWEIIRDIQRRRYDDDR